MEQTSLINESIKNFMIDIFSADNFCPDNERKKLELRYASLLKITDKFNRQNVSYQLNKKDILHRWLKYKEGFSANLVNMLLDEFNIKPDDWIMDPFIGSGTTALVCQLRGINIIGYDILPISEISVKAKTAIFTYDVKELRKMLMDIVNIELPNNYSKRISYIKITKDAYPEKNEKFLAYIQNWNNLSSYSGEAKNLLTLCIINSLERCSYTSKVGQYLKWDCRSTKIKKLMK